MKLFSATQIRDWDEYTIANEPVTSINLMERAAIKCFEWLTEHFNEDKIFFIFCGTGNNGGDGLAIARMLNRVKSNVQVYIIDGKKRSNDFMVNLERLAAENITPHFITSQKDIPYISNKTIVIDTLFGTGLKRPLEGLASEIVQHINHSDAIVISIDIPSGLFADQSSIKNSIIQANHTLTFQPKLAFMMAENASYVGDVHLLNIGLHKKFYNEANTPYSIIDKKIIRSIYKPRHSFSHKYNYGHAFLFAGSRDMTGAAILCAKACLRSGAGLITVHTDFVSQAIIQTVLPEAITSTENDIEKLFHKKNAIGIGPGLEASAHNSDILKNIITQFKGALVIDATALNLLVSFPEYLLQRPENPAIVTPHTGEFEKLFGKTRNDYERIQVALDKAAAFNCYIILKGHYTFIASPGGEGFFNFTGNPGMATAGSGDVLTGIITGLLAQGYTQREACLLGVYLHGLAGDIAAKKFSQEAMIAGDIIDCLGEGFKIISRQG